MSIQVSLLFLMFLLLSMVLMSLVFSVWLAPPLIWALLLSMAFLLFLIDLALSGVSSVAVADIPAISGVASAAGGLVVISSPVVDGGSSVAGSPVMAFTAGFSAFVGYLLLLVSLQLLLSITL